MNLEPKECPDCGSTVPVNAPGGLCPKCLLVGAANPTETGSAAASDEREQPPGLEEIARAFPQLEIRALLGQGGMGFVYRARQPKLERDVALKVLPRRLARDVRFAGRFTREGRLLAKLNHPNIVGVFDFGESGGFYFLLMEFVDGVNLRQAMRASRFTAAQALAIVPKICEALQYAHDEGVLHRDIKPENILIDAKGRVKIADFGIAKLMGAPDRDAGITATGASLGTPHYMAPEQLETPTEVDHRADIYSVGVVFYELLTGELPIGRFAPPSARTPISERVDEIVLRALARERELRQQSARELQTEVETVADAKAPGAGSDQGVDDWRTWVPFQSPEVREIYRHLTPEERRADRWVQATPVALTFLLLLGLVVMLDALPRDWWSTRLALLPVFILAQLAVLVVSVSRAKNFLCSSKWAKERGIKPEQLRTLVWPEPKSGGGTGTRTRRWANLALGCLIAAPLGMLVLMAFSRRDEVALAFGGLLLLLSLIFGLAGKAVRQGRVVIGVVVGMLLTMGIALAILTGVFSRSRARANIEQERALVAAELARAIAKDGAALDSSRSRPEPAETSGLTAGGVDHSAFDSVAPVVVETFPVSGDRDVPAGVHTLRLRFSKPMMDRAWSWAEAWPGSTPELLEEPEFDESGRACSVNARLEPNRTYAFWLNSELHRNFQDVEGRPAVPYLLIFETGDP